MPDDFSAFFQAATGPGRTPYDYQQRLASLPCESRLINIPTGLGKTAAVILAWLWNRVHKADPKWPQIPTELPRFLPYWMWRAETNTQTGAEVNQVAWGITHLPILQRCRACCAGFKPAALGSDVKLLRNKTHCDMN